MFWKALPIARAVLSCVFSTWWSSELIVFYSVLVVVPASSFVNWELSGYHAWEMT